ncbi:MAG: sugar phosphate isomerase/epimerase [Granulosicoccus sp.]
MKISATSWSFTACSLQEAWAITRALGVEYLDLGLLHTPALDRATILNNPQKAAQVIRDIGIRVSNLYWLFGDTPHDRPVSRAEVQSENLSDFKQVLAFARALECPSLFLLPGVQRPHHSKQDLLVSSAAALREMVALTEAQDMVLTIEPHVGGLLDSPDAVLQFLDDVPGLKLTLDYSHFVCMGYTQTQIDVLAPHAAHVHMRQARPGELQAKWGEGTLDFGMIIETLRATGYDNFLSLEYVHQDYMGTLYDDVLTETIRMRDLINSYIN